MVVVGVWRVGSEWLQRINVGGWGCCMIGLASGFRSIFCSEGITKKIILLASSLHALAELPKHNSPSLSTS